MNPFRTVMFLAFTVMGAWLAVAVDAEASPGAVVVNGHTMTAAQVQQFHQTYGNPPIPGTWWYDPQSGLYGPVGGPPIGQMNAGHRYGRLAASASAGNTGVFLNGRELPATELAVYARQVGPVTPGRYWMDHSGNVGREGQTQVVANLLGGAARAPNAAGQTPSTPAGTPKPVQTYTDAEGYTWQRHLLDCQLTQGPGTLLLEVSYINDVGLIWDTTTRPSATISGVVGLDQKIRYMRGEFRIGGQRHAFKGRGQMFTIRETLDNSMTGKFELHGSKLAVFYPWSNPTPGYCTPAG